jgi:hypothetical protein
MIAEGQDDLGLPRQRLNALYAERDHSASVRLVVGFSAGWMTSMLVNMSGPTFDGQLSRYVLAWTLPLLLASPGILAHLDHRAAERGSDLQPATISKLDRP